MNLTSACWLSITNYSALAFIDLEPDKTQLVNHGIHQQKTGIYSSCQKEEYNWIVLHQVTQVNYKKSSAEITSQVVRKETGIAIEKGKDFDAFLQEIEDKVHCCITRDRIQSSQVCSCIVPQEKRSVFVRFQEIEASFYRSFTYEVSFAWC